MRIDPEQLKAFQGERTAAAIGKTLAEKQGLKLGQKITLKGDIYAVNLELTIRAIFEGTADSSDNRLVFPPQVCGGIPDGSTQRPGRNLCHSGGFSRGCAPHRERSR